MSVITPTIAFSQETSLTERVETASVAETNPTTTHDAKETEAQLKKYELEQRAYKLAEQKEQGNKKNSIGKVVKNLIKGVFSTEKAYAIPTKPKPEELKKEYLFKDYIHKTKQKQTWKEERQEIRDDYTAVLGRDYLALYFKAEDVGEKFEDALSTPIRRISEKLDPEIDVKAKVNVWNEAVTITLTKHF